MPKLSSSASGDDGSDPLFERPVDMSMATMLQLCLAQLGTDMSPKVRDAITAKITPELIDQAQREAALKGEENQPLSVVLVILERLGLATTLGRMDVSAIEGILDIANTAMSAGNAGTILSNIKEAVGGDKGEIRRLLGRQPIRRETEKVGRNDACVCGSGKKYKHCCMRKPPK